MSTYYTQNIVPKMYTWICALHTVRLLLIYPVVMLMII